MTIEVTSDQFIDYYCQRAQIAWECLQQQHAAWVPRIESSAIYVVQPPAGWQTELVKALPTALIAAIAVYVAWRQYRVARNKLKFDLFDKRYAIFRRTWKILSGVVHDGTRKKSYGLGTPFNNLLPQASFLFGKDIAQYLDVATTKWTELWALDGERPDLQGQQRIDANAKASELRQWFFDQATKGAKQAFGRYLNFDGWK